MAIEHERGAAVRGGVGCSWSVDTVPLAGDGDIVVLRLVGEFDLSTDPILREALGAVTARAPAYLVIDLVEVGFCGASQLRQLADVHTGAPVNGIGFALCGLSRSQSRACAVVWGRDCLPQRYPSARDAITVWSAAALARAPGAQPSPNERAS
ncbi:MAG: STAS domain-containing protein [Pseudonocardiales bacterium]|nr:STAS domain-containing protein [Pseudonocardiales bacterium]